MGDKGCCKLNNASKGLLIGLAIAVLIFAAFHFAHSKPDLSESLNHLSKLFPRSGNANVSTVPEEILEHSKEHPKDVRLKTTQDDINDLLESIEAYKSNIPNNIVDAVQNLISDHQAVVVTINPTTTAPTDVLG